MRSNDKLKKHRFYTIIAFILTCINVIAEVVYKFFSVQIKTLFNVDVFLIYSLVSLVLLLISILMRAKKFVSGLRSVFKFKKNYESPLSFASLAALVQSVLNLILYIFFKSEPAKLYSCLVVTLVFFDFYGNYIYEKHFVDNLKFFSVPAIRRSVRVLSHVENARPALGEEYGFEFCYSQRTNSFKHLSKIAKGRNPGDSINYNISVIGWLLSLIIGICNFIMCKNVFSAVSVLTASACMCVPVATKLVADLSLKKISMNCHKVDAAIGGFETIKKFGNVNGVIVNSTDLYPRRKIILQGIKTVNGSLLDQTLVCAAAVINSVDSPLRVIMSRIVKGKRVNLLSPKDVVYEEGRGLVGWVNGKRILIGNRDLLLNHGFSPPSRDFEKKHLSENKKVVYFAIGYDLVTMFVLSYVPNLEFQNDFRTLSKLGVKVFVRSLDCNVTPEMIARDFNVYYDSVKLISNSDNIALSKKIDSELDSDDAYAITLGKTKSLFKIITSCIKAKSSILLATIISTISTVMGLCLVAFLMLYTTIDHIGSFELLVYIILWTCCSILVPEIILRGGKEK